MNSFHSLCLDETDRRIPIGHRSQRRFRGPRERSEAQTGNSQINLDPLTPSEQQPCHQCTSHFQHQPSIARLKHNVCVSACENTFQDFSVLLRYAFDILARVDAYFGPSSQQEVHRSVDYCENVIRVGAVDTENQVSLHTLSRVKLDSDNLEREGGETCWVDWTWNSQKFSTTTHFTDMTLWYF